ncbi:MAG: hypothetical protein HY015_08935 [Bacteroidetes bacterium]|nr:hypothetical protein [Bacteroidota bacterium]MBI3483080.1 hypothetical protein [Bacteroidota bacterium]
MNTRRIIFLSLFGVYHLSVLLFTIYMESKKDDLNFLFEMFKEISLFKYGAMVGLVLLVIEFIWSRNDARKVVNP